MATLLLRNFRKKELVERAAVRLLRLTASNGASLVADTDGLHIGTHAANRGARVTCAVVLARAGH